MDAQTDAVVALLDKVLAGDVAGAYLYGSSVLGGRKPRSDIDVFAVVRRRTTPAERRAIIAGLTEISGLFPPAGEQRPVELTVVVESDVRPWRYPPTMEMQYGEWLRSEFLAGAVPSRRPNPDLAVVITTVRLANEQLVGPPAEELLEPVPGDDLRRAMVDCLPGLLNDVDSDTCNVLLTLARIWTTLATGEIRSKDAAADWALDRLPPEHRPALKHARAVYVGEAREDWADKQPGARGYVEFVSTRLVRRCGNG